MIKINKALVAGLALTAALATFTQNAEARKITIGDAIGILGSIGGGSVDGISNIGKQKHAVANMNDSQKLLMLGVANGDIEIVSQMLAQGLDIDGVYDDRRYRYGGVTPLCLALDYRNIEMIQFLLEQGADVDGFYDFNNNRISYIVSAAGNNDLELVKLFHECGAKVNSMSKDRDGSYNAVNSIVCNYQYYPSEELLRYLVAEGINLNVKKDGLTPFLFMVKHRSQQLGTIEVLAECGADLSARDANGQNALQYAAAQSDIKYYKFIKDIYDRGQQPGYYNPDN
ncbi:MAG: ankyrin repeat domain-containing protein [Selenomonadaceae bacterium]|nr:ankyrin repeat domain-containing protein [Selenomonadaceae bacterium]